MDKPTFGKWQPIASAPTDTSRFLVGVWIGEQLYNDDYSKFVWASKPTFHQTVSHDENASKVYGVRGWNHRNGPLPQTPTVWCPLPDEPELTEPVVDMVEGDAEVK